MMDTTILNPGNGIPDELEEDLRLRIQDLESKNENLRQDNTELLESLEKYDETDGLRGAANVIADAERFRTRFLGYKPLSPIHGMLTLEVDATAGDALAFRYDDEWTLSGAIMQDFAALEQEV